MKESVTYQAILEEGEAKGRIAEAKRLLLLLGQGRFGSPDARARLAVEKITDVEQLEALSERLLTAASWAELLGQPTPHRSQPRRRPKA